MVDTSYEAFRGVHALLGTTGDGGLATQSDWVNLTEERRREIMGHLHEFLNGKHTVLYRSDVPDTAVVPW